MYFSLSKTQVLISGMSFYSLCSLRLISKSAIRTYVETHKFIILILVQTSLFEKVMSFVIFCFLLKIIISTDFKSSVNINTSILFTELCYNIEIIEIIENH